MTDHPSDAMRELVTFTVGAQRYCVDIMDVRELRGWSLATRIPHAPNFVHGVINLRGAVLPIIDLSARFGLGQADPTARHVVMVVSIDRKLVGLLVDAVSDIIVVPRNELRAPPDTVGDELREFVEAFLTMEDRLIGLVKLAAINASAESLAA